MNAAIAIDKELFNAARNSTQSLIYKKKKFFFKEKLNENIGKPKELWKSLNSLGLPSKNKSGSKICHHHHSFNVSVPIKVGCTAPMFVPSFFLHSILFAGSALDSFQCLRSLLIVSFHVFFGLNENGKLNFEPKVNANIFNIFRFTKETAQP